ncbi:MAG TPA: NAD(P)H-dependent oxidoreductase subunit E [Bellilinea sp.]|mgnify:CR=1 FL=1|nr:NAD(P)H-dependent oxidoreductase subunit E [Bellilinea sp.]
MSPTAIASPAVSKIDPEIKKVIDAIIEEHAGKNGATMVVLNNVQKQVGYISKEMQQYIADAMRVPVSVVHGVVSFYSFFTTEPRGKHTIKFCMGTACYVGGTPQLIEKAKSILGIDPGSTTADGLITLEVCRCVGACSQAPVVAVDEDTIGRLRPNKFPQIIKSLQSAG